MNLSVKKNKALRKLLRKNCFRKRFAKYIFLLFLISTRHGKINNLTYS